MKPETDFDFDEYVEQCEDDKRREELRDEEQLEAFQVSSASLSRAARTPSDRRMPTYFTSSGMPVLFSGRPGSQHQANLDFHVLLDVEVAAGE